MQFIVDAIQKAVFENMVYIVVNCYKSGGRIYIAGNGGSVVDVQHLATEFVSKLARDSSLLPSTNSRYFHYNGYRKWLRIQLGFFEIN
jgi:D-sedoheptulose 7-phosphate isomerase